MTRRRSPLLSAALALLLAGCGGGGDDDVAPDPAPTPSNVDLGCGQSDFEAEALRLLNERRAAGASCGRHGDFAPAPPLAWDDRLAAAAHRHSLAMAQHDFFSHTGRDGDGVGDRVRASGYAWSRVGENIAAGQRSVPDVVAGWMASEGHCAVIMTAAYVHAGMACVATTSATYRRYWTLNLATPR